MHLPEWTYVDFGQNSTEIHPQGPNQQHSSIGADIGLVPTGRQTTIWTNDDYFNDAYKRHSTLMSQQEKYRSNEVREKDTFVHKCWQ